MMRSLIVFFFLVPVGLFGQFSLRGSIKNIANESLDASTVFLVNTSYMAATDINGLYAITNIKSGTYTIKVSYVGYKSIVQTIDIQKDSVIDFVMEGEIFQLDNVEIQANRAKDKGPFTKVNLSSKEIQKENQGQDVPFVLQWTPSVVVSSDAGAGIGYTNLRMRGTDQTRINVTLNGAPVNDAESHNVFWVDLPDLMSSTTDVQIQRGVGTSTNGPGAFGGSISINTSKVKVNPYAEVTGGIGSFGTRRFSVAAGTGLMNNKYAVDVRYSQTGSDGYIARSTSQLSSAFICATRIWEKSSLRLNFLQGKEVTYQSWYGVPSSKLGIGKDNLSDHYGRNVGSVYKTTQDSINLFSSDRRYNFYTHPIQTDDYTQNYLQLIYSKEINNQWKYKVLAYYTQGAGAYGEYRPNDLITNYGLIPKADSSNVFDARRKRWLDNDLIGSNIDLIYSPSKKMTWEAGVTYNIYLGDHFGTLASDEKIDFPLGSEGVLGGYYYYQSESTKQDISSYVRALYDINPKWQLTTDIQLRDIAYTIQGKNSDLRALSMDNNYLFFNPKFGVTYLQKTNQRWYASYAVGHKEPSRGDFVDVLNSPKPKPEQLHDIEAGYEIKQKSWAISSNIYGMIYRDQLILTGALNDVGAPLRINVPSSHRIGLEIDGMYRLSPKWVVSGSLTLSRNKIKNFDEVIYDYTNGFDRKIIGHSNTDISFSPSVIQNISLSYLPLKNIEVSISSKYVSRQYIDNTSNLDRSMPSFHYQNLRLTWTPIIKKTKLTEVSLLVNNLLNNTYVSNGYTYSYIFGDRIDESYYYPQAGINFLANVKVRF